MAIDYGALLNELQTDPLALGYAPLLAAGNDLGVANLLNAVGQGAGFQVPREPITTAFFLSNVVASEYLALSALKISQLTPLMAAQTIDINDASTQSILVGIFGGASATKTAIVAILNRQGSRAEVLFGRGTLIRAFDVAHAFGRS